MCVLDFHVIQLHSCRITSLFQISDFDLLFKRIWSYIAYPTNNKKTEGQLVWSHLA